MFCPRCGKEVPNGFKFCGSCGLDLAAYGQSNTMVNPNSNPNPNQPQRAPMGLNNQPYNHPGQYTYVPPNMQPQAQPQWNNNVPMKRCKKCGQMIPANMNVCPYCKKKQKTSKLAIIAGVLVVLMIIGTIGSSGGNKKNESSSSSFSSSSNSSSSSSSSSSFSSSSQSSGGASSANKSSEEFKSLLKKNIESFEGGEYLFILGEDLQKYCYNLSGEKVYTVGKVSDIKDGIVQLNLGDGYMMSSFNTSTDYSKYIAEDDVVAIYGVVGEATDYSLLGTSVEIDNCEVFAVGSDANKYKKDATDEGLAEYLVVTDAVANANDVSPEEYKSLCEYRDYEDILRNPDSYKKAYTIVTGSVDQIIEGLFGAYTFYIVDSNGNKWECVYSYKDEESHLLEGDWVTVYGKCNGTSNSTTVLGKQVTMPYIQLDYID